MSSRKLFVGALVAIVAGAALVIGIIAQDRARLRKAKELAEQRPAAVIAHSRALPTGKTGTPIDWTAIHPFGDGAVVLGHTRDKGHPVLLTVDAHSAATAAYELPTSCPVARALVPVSRTEAIIMCTIDRTLAWIAMRREGDHISFAQMQSETVAPMLGAAAEISAFARGTRHYWVLNTPGQGLVIGTGEGVSVPKFASSLHSAVSVAPFEEERLLLAQVEQDRTLLLRTIDLGDGRVRTITVTEGRNAQRLTQPSVVFDGSSIGVFWVELPKSGISQLPTQQSLLMYRLYDRTLQARAPEQRLTEDSYVAHLSVQSFMKGFLITWEQGVRQAWQVPSFMHLSDLSGISSATAFRFPFGRLPQGAAICDRVIVALASSTEQVFEADRFVILQPARN